MMTKLTGVPKHVGRPPRKERVRPFTFYVSADLDRELRDLAVAMNLNLTQVVNRAVREYLSGHRGVLIGQTNGDRG